MADAAPGSLAAACEHIDAAAELAANREILRRHEELAEQLAAAGAAEDAVDVIAGAAQLAVLRHPGVLASTGMERVLAGLGAAQLRPIAPRGRPASPATVLHVATELYPVGGHSRVLWRWIDRDPGRTHSVVLTAQRGALPEGVAAAVAATGGRIDGLDPASPALQ